jgi:hypothetical protein
VKFDSTESWRMGLMLLNRDALHEESCRNPYARVLWVDGSSTSFDPIPVGQAVLVFGHQVQHFLTFRFKVKGLSQEIRNQLNNKISL